MDTSVDGLSNFNLQYLVDKLQVIVIGKSNFLRTVLLGVWLVYWALVMCSIPIIFFYEFGSELSMPLFILLVVLLGILIVWQGILRIVVGAYLFLWQLRGEEIIQIGYNEITIQRKIFGIGPTARYDINQVRNIQVVDPIILPFAFTKIPGTTLRVVAQGPIAFKYNRATIRFGNGLDAKEAKAILTKIQDRFPRLNYGGGTEMISDPLYLKFWMFMYRY